MSDAETPERALVVTAHPDDVDFGAAGTIATWTAAGTAVTYCIVTDGNAGAVDRDTDLAKLAEVRQAEQTAAAAEVGVHDVRFLGYPDGRLEVSMALRRDIARVIRSVRPHRLISQSPERNWDRVRATLITWRQERRPLTPSTPTPAILSPTPSCSRRASSRTRSTRSG
jgi:LmbE family N-acetylglucosaminyl deacetylase